MAGGLWLDSNIWGGGSSGRMTACVIAFVINIAAKLAGKKLKKN